MKKVRYGRLWSFGNYENESIQLEEEFPDDVSYSEALSFLQEKVTKDHEKRIRMREVIQEIDSLERSSRALKEGGHFYGEEPTSEQVTETIASTNKQLNQAKRELRKLNKELLGV